MSIGNAVVTGGSRGIGAAIATALAKEGYNVVVSYVSRPDAAEEVVKNLRALGVQAEAFKADLSRAEDAKALFDYAVGLFGTIDVWINNAGMKGRCPYLESDLEWIEKLYQTNLMGVVYCDWHIIRHMVANGKGRIITISSVGGLVGFAGNSEYSGGKAALIGRAKAIAKEIGPMGVLYNIVAPGATNTDMLARSAPEDVEALRQSLPTRKIVQPEEIADAVMYLIHADSMTGQCLAVTGGQYM